MKTELGHLDIPEKIRKCLHPLLPKIKTNRLDDRLAMAAILELLKNSMIQFNKTASNAHFNEAETDRGLIFQQLYFTEFEREFSGDISLRCSDQNQRYIEDFRNG